MREVTPPSPRKPAKTPSRTAAFREAARAIVAKDRYDRRIGFSVDTAGAIARALERAYAQGFADAQAPPSPPSTPQAGDFASNLSSGYERGRLRVRRRRPLRR